jgi:hypothetical protein
VRVLVTDDTGTREPVFSGFDQLPDKAGGARRRPAASQVKPQMISTRSCSRPSLLARSCVAHLDAVVNPSHKNGRL